MSLQIHVYINKCKYIHTREHISISVQGNKEDIVNTNILAVLGQWKLSNYGNELRELGSNTFFEN